MVARKVLHGDREENHLALFRREFEVLADLSHDRLVRVHDFGRTADGRTCFTRDFVDGDDLLSATAGTDPQTLLAICVETCRALRPLHRAGLLHGDIKPTNLMVEGGPSPRVRAIDFSFTHLAAGATPPRGTVPYMPPELLAGDSVDHRSDLYSLGISFHEILTGARPFDGTIDDIIAAHLADARPRLHATRFNARSDEERGILRGLEDITHRLMARRPDDRFPDLDELEAALTGLAPSKVPADDNSRVPSMNLLGDRQDIVSRISGAVRTRLDGQQGDGLLVLQGEAGSGRRAVARAVKWQAQLRDAHTAWISFEGTARSLQFLTRLWDQLDGWIPPDLDEEFRALRNDIERPDGIARRASRTARLIASCARRRPLLLILEDLDRASPEALTIIRAVLAHNGPDVRLFVLATVRDDCTRQNLIGQAESLTMPPFALSTVSSLIERTIGRSAVSSATDVLQHTGGNPLFVISLLEAAVRTGKTLSHLVSRSVPVTLTTRWEEQLSRLPDDALRVLRAAAILDHPSPLTLLCSVAEIPSPARDAIDTLIERRLLTDGPSGAEVSTAAFADLVRARMTDTERISFSRRAFELEQTDERRLRHAAVCREVDFVRRRGTAIAEDLIARGSPGAAADILDTIVSSPLPDDVIVPCTMLLCAVRIQMGDIDGAAAQLDALARHQQGPEDVRMKHLQARIAVRRGRFDDAASLLESVVEMDAPGRMEGPLLCELCEVEFRRGRIDACIRACDKGLDGILVDCPDRIALLCTKAKALAALARHQEALAIADDAIDAARRCGADPSLAFAIDVRAWILSLLGRMEESAQALEEAIALYRATDNLPRLSRSLQVLGNHFFWMEQWSRMLEHHEEAARLSATMEDPVQRNEILISRAFSLLCVGRFEEAALTLSRAGEEAERTGNLPHLFKVAVYEGDLAARQGRSVEAQKKWCTAYDGFMGLGEFAICAEVALEMARAHIAEKTPSSLQEATRLIDEATSHPRADLGRNFDSLLEFTRCQLLFATGHFEDALPRIDRLVETLEGTGQRDLLWQAHLTAAANLLDRGSHVLSKGRLRRAAAILEGLASGLPAEHQRAFWQDVRRAQVKQLLASMSDISSTELVDAGRRGSSDDRESALLYRILAFNRRIATETDTEALMTAILDGAIDISRAERGFILGPAKGGLEVLVAREMTAEQTGNPHTQFSRSIAESVYLDREAVITVDATGDRRFNEFLSIHHLQVRSVACVPLLWRGTALGVLYLENRLRSGCFDEADLRVLHAFADQVAVTLSHASALAEARRINEELTAAREQLEALVSSQREDLESRTTRLSLAQQQIARIRHQVEGRQDYFGLIGNGPAMRRVFDIVERVKDNAVPVMIVGCSGTGKDAIARVIHEAGCRSGEPFIPVACGAIPETLVESLLFGHEKGAFSGADKSSAGIFATAGAGTVYLDNIAEMSARMQINLLRVLQEGVFTPLGSGRSVQTRFRVLCSCSSPLEELVQNGRLREDLYYRLQVMTIRLPSLAERQEDLPRFVRLFADREAARLGHPKPAIDRSVVPALSRRPLPGNIRELEHLVCRVFVLHGGTDRLTADMFTDQDPLSPQSAHRKTEGPGHDDIVAVLEQCQWNRSEAARILGIPRRTFYRRLKSMNLL